MAFTRIQICYNTDWQTKLVFYSPTELLEALESLHIPRDKDVLIEVVYASVHGQYFWGFKNNSLRFADGRSFLSVITKAVQRSNDTTSLLLELSRSTNHEYGPARQPSFVSVFVLDRYLDHKLIFNAGDLADKPDEKLYTAIMSDKTFKATREPIVIEIDYGAPGQWQGFTATREALKTVIKLAARSWLKEKY